MDRRNNSAPRARTGFSPRSIATASFLERCFQNDPLRKIGKMAGAPLVGIPRVIPSISHLENAGLFSCLEIKAEGREPSGWKRGRHGSVRVRFDPDARASRLVFGCDASRRTCDWRVVFVPRNKSRRARALGSELRQTWLYGSTLPPGCLRISASIWMLTHLGEHATAGLFSCLEIKAEGREPSDRN